MLTVLESINLSTDYLEKKGIDSARTNAELLLASILKCKRLDLYMSFNRPLSDAEKIKYREYISRRGTFEPLQYIVGDVEFYGITLKVNKSVLIPRQETEILIEEIINAVNHEDEIKILDIGSGSGNIALALAKNLSNTEVVGIDVSEEAVELAKRNAEVAELSLQVKFFKLDIFDYDISKTKDKFDIVVSNPPYVSDEEYQTLQKEIIEYEPSLAVTDSADGFKFYEHITNISKTLLKDGGKLFYEIGKGQAEKVISILEQNGFSDIKVKKDYAEIERVVSGVRQ